MMKKISFRLLRLGDDVLTVVSVFNSVKCSPSMLQTWTLMWLAEFATAACSDHFVRVKFDSYVSLCTKSQ